MRNVGILIFDDVEILDFCGPYEVFSVTQEINDDNLFNVFTVAEKSLPILTRNGLSVNPKYAISEAPHPDILLIPGGRGARKEMYNSIILDWIKDCSSEAELLLSVCTGSLLLAKLGLLDGLKSTTHHTIIDLLKQVAPKTYVDQKKRFIDNGTIIVSAGISAGIDMSLYVVSRLLGKEYADRTAKYMEYNWNPEKLDL